MPGAALCPHVSACPSRHSPALGCQLLVLDGTGQSSGAGTPGRIPDYFGGPFLLPLSSVPFFSFRGALYFSSPPGFARLALPLFPSPFHCVHPPPTLPGSPWKNSFYFSLDDSNTSSGSSDSSNGSGSSSPTCQVTDAPSKPSPSYAIRVLVAQDLAPPRLPQLQRWEQGRQAS